MAPRDKTACQTFPCKCKICISSIESDVYNKKKIQMFVVNMTFISSREVKKCIFHSCLRHSWNIHFFTSLDEIKVIFTPNIWISSIYYFKIYSALLPAFWKGSQLCFSTVLYTAFLLYSRLSLSRIPRDPLKYFEISVARHIRFAELRKK